MSFPRAKRFNYKNPDIELSPADYNISRPLNKGCRFEKSPRFREKPTNSDDWTNLACSRWNCCRETPLECSTPHKRRGRRNGSDINRRVKDPTSSDSIQAPLSRDQAGKKAADAINEKHFQNTGSKCEMKETVNFVDAETFIDDDFNSYTSSEEFSGCPNRLEKKFDKLGQKQLNWRYKDIFLRRFRELENRLENLRVMMYRLFEERHTEQQDRKMAKLYNAQSPFDISQNSEIRKNFHDAIKETIKKAITKLLDELDMKIMYEKACSERKLSQLINEIRASKSDAEKKTEELCEKVASDLTKKIMDILNDQLISRDALDLNISGTSEEIAEGLKCVYQMNHDCFNYENICKVLSDQLQESKDELLDMKQDTIDITIRCSGTQQILEGHASIFMKLRDEIAAIKRDFTDN